MYEREKKYFDKFGKIWVRDIEGGEWFLATEPKWNNLYIYVIDDKYSKYRKSEASGNNVYILNGDDMVLKDINEDFYDDFSYQDENDIHKNKQLLRKKENFISLFRLREDMIKNRQRESDLLEEITESWFTIPNKYGDIILCRNRGEETIQIYCYQDKNKKYQYYIHQFYSYHKVPKYFYGFDRLGELIVALNEEYCYYSFSEPISRACFEEIHLSSNSEANAIRNDWSII